MIQGKKLAETVNTDGWLFIWCNLHNYRTQASCFHICDDWLEDDREKVTMIDDMGHAFRMPKMENSGFII